MNKYVYLILLYSLIIGKDMSKSDNYEYDFSSYEDEFIEEHKAKLLSMVRFSNLAKENEENEENIPKIMKYLWDDVLSVHPITKNIFLKGKMKR